MSDSYADHPQSLAEVKATKEHRGDLWTPRDALIYMLREVDAGRVNPTSLVISYTIDDDQGRRGVHNEVAARDKVEAVGILTISSRLITDPDDVR